MSFVNANAPNVLVTVNNVLSVCKGNCEYQALTANTPVLNSFSVSGNTVTLDLSGNSMTIDASNTKLWYAGSECNSPDFSSISAITCTVTDIESG
jgi:hypothetical protein